MVKGYILLKVFLSWQYHVNDLSIELNKANALLFKMRKYVSLKILRSIYFVIFDSYLSYCCLAWVQNCETSFPSFQPVGYNIGWCLLFHIWCKTIKWSFLFPVSKNATKMCVCKRFHLCWKWTPLQIIDSFSCHSKFEFAKWKFSYALVVYLCLVSKSAKNI